MTEPEERVEPGVRFDATVHPGDAGVAMEGLADLDVDRVPGPANARVRVLVDVDDCRRLVEAGFEVRLRRVVPVRPLDPALVMGDDDAVAWLDEQVRRAGGRDTGGEDAGAEGTA